MDATYLKEISIGVFPRENRFLTGGNMYQHKSGVGRKHYVVYTDLTTGEKAESPTFKTLKDADVWIERHARENRS